MSFSIARLVFESSIARPTATALVTERGELTQQEFADRSRRVAAWLRHRLGRRPERVGVLATRSLGACCGVLGAHWAGGAFVPVSLKLPEERLAAVLSLAQLDALIVDGKGAALLTPAVLAACPAAILLAEDAPAIDGIDSLASQPDDGAPPERLDGRDIAYIIFTSGTTGLPKGVVIEAAALWNFARTMQDTYGFTAADRIAETADISFDLSVGNMFMTWAAGASLHVVPATQAQAPAAFIQAQALTVWFSVPSVIAFMMRMRLLRPGQFPSLRHSLFIGEPLPLASALAWADAAPNSAVENLYGPTEATVGCTRYPLASLVKPAASEAGSASAIVAIGKALAGTEMTILSENLEAQPAGARGELALSGVQLAAGYFNDPALTEARFPVMNGTRWYLTGDFAMRDADGIYHHLGRIDHQVKVNGYRIEIEDVEAHLRAAAGTGQVAAVAWPVAHGVASGLIGFVSGEQRPPADIRDRMREKVPPYMLPSVIYAIDEIPHTANGKIDRKTLLTGLGDGRYH